MSARRLSPQQRRLLEALRAGATLRYAGWQQVAVTYPDPPHGRRDERNFTAMQATLYALRDRGLVALGADGVVLTDMGPAPEEAA